MNNPIQWLEIATSDIERAKQFYQKVFNLSFEFVEMPDSKMYMFGAPDAIGSSGCLVQGEGYVPSAGGTVVYFECIDVNDELSRIAAAGGHILIAKTDIGEFGYFAHVMDSEGNRIGLHSDQ